MSYDRVIDALTENDLSWTEVDRIELNEDTYAEFESRSSFKQASKSDTTTDKTAVRKTTGQERIVYVAEGGIEVTIEI